MTFYVYIMLCLDGSFYTGYTKNVEERFKLHVNGNGARYTRIRKPKKIVHIEQFKSRIEAIHRERQIKKLSHKQKEELSNSSNNKT